MEKGGSHTTGSAMFETTKPATPGTNRTISLNFISFWVFYRDRSFLWEKLFTGSPSRQPTVFPIFFISFSLIVIDFEVLELIPAVDVAFTFVYFLSWSSVWIIPSFLLLRKYCIFSDSFKSFDYLKLLFMFKLVLCMHYLTFWIKMLKYSWDIKWVFFIENA